VQVGSAVRPGNCAALLAEPVHALTAGSGVCRVPGQEERGAALRVGDLHLPSAYPRRPLVGGNQTTTAPDGNPLRGGVGPIEAHRFPSSPVSESTPNAMSHQVPPVYRRAPLGSGAGRVDDYSTANSVPCLT